MNELKDISQNEGGKLVFYSIVMVAVSLIMGAFATLLLFTSAIAAPVFGMVLPMFVIGIIGAVGCFFLTQFNLKIWFVPAILFSIPVLITGVSAVGHEKVEYIYYAIVEFFAFGLLGSWYGKRFADKKKQSVPKEP
jgi:hypothetical protein